MISLLFAAALAQPLPSTPTLSAQNLRLSVDGRAFFSTDLSGIRAGQRGALRLVSGYAARPLVLEREGGQRIDYVQDLVHADLLGGYSLGPVRLGAHLPVAWGSGAMGSSGGLGDLALDLRITALDGARAPIGVGLSGRLIAPTSTLQGMALRNGGVAWEAGASLDAAVGPTLLALNLGMEGNPPQRLVEEQRWATRVSLRAGVLASVSSWVDLTAEVDAGFSLQAPFADPLGTPAELLLGAHVHTRRGVAVTVGGAAGLSRGVGAPVGRALIGLAWERPQGWARVEPAPAPPSPTCTDGTTPGPEGCPPPGVRVRVRFVDPQGAPVSGVAAAIDGDAAGQEGWTVRAGPHRLTASVAGYAAVDQELSIPGDVDGWESVIVIQPALAPGELVVRLRDPEGAPLPATVRVDELERTATGELRLTLPAGDHLVDVASEGSGAMRVRVYVPAGAEETLELTLHPARVIVGEDRIELRERIHFETDRDVILQESAPLLGEIAAVLQAHAEITTLVVEGHTDDRGSEPYNRDLSQRRAAAVVRALIGYGVAPDRLLAVGYGEALPLSHQAGEAGWALNRRVELRILRRAGDAPAPGEEPAR